VFQRVVKFVTVPIIVFLNTVSLRRDDTVGRTVNISAKNLLLWLIIRVIHDVKLPFRKHFTFSLIFNFDISVVTYFIKTEKQLP
jgi:hypothetical protein